MQQSNAVMSEEFLPAELTLAERYLRPRQTVELLCEFTRDPGYLHQYFRLRAREQARAWGVLSGVLSQGDEIDAHSHILVARRGNQVLAGGRLTVSSPRKPQLLPMEQQKFRLAHALPQLGLGYRKYAEFSRPAMEAEFQENHPTSLLFQHMIRKTMAMRVEYLFTAASAPQARLYSKAFAQCGHDSEMVTDIALPEAPEHEGVRMHLIMTSIWQEDRSSAAEIRAFEDTESLIYSDA